MRGILAADVAEPYAAWYRAPGHREVTGEPGVLEEMPGDLSLGARTKHGAAWGQQGPATPLQPRTRPVKA